MTIAPPGHARPGPPQTRLRRGRSRKSRRRRLGSQLIGGLGEILITLGVLGLLFVV